MTNGQTEQRQRGLWYERPLGVVRGFLKEPDVPPADPEADEERQAIQGEGETQQRAKTK